ncbi:MAG: hypothetical protein H6713_30985 [Myxococcales bacterium]|nr:hypothetical protein [Myxococcales bacterium]
MSTIHILHHGQCFDGAASAAIVTAFLEQHLGLELGRGIGGDRVRYRAKDHRPGDPYDDDDFAADLVASVDFRYSQDPRLSWFFDHHRSAFQLPGDREHFLADTSGQKFHDSSEISCAGYIARLAHARFGCDLSEHSDLITWADQIDSAAFPTPELPVTLNTPAMRVMAFVESNRDPELVQRLITDLLSVPLARLAEARYVREALTPILERHRADVALIGRRIRIEGIVASFTLLDQPPRAVNKFIPYFHHPTVPYVIAATRGPGWRIKITAGYNPWLPKAAREHNMADLLEPYGGGGHPFVAGCSFAADEEERALTTVRELTDALNTGRPQLPCPTLATCAGHP